MRGNDHRHLRRKTDALADHRVARIVGGVGIEGGKRQGRGAHHVHRMRRFDAANDVEDRRGQFTRGFQGAVEFGELRFGRQFAVQQQPRRLLECRMLGEIMDRIAAIAQLADAAVDEGARRAVEIDALQSAVNLDWLVCFGHLWPRSRRYRLAAVSSGMPGSARIGTMMNPIERCFDTGRRRHFKIVLPEGDDIRVLRAARGLIEREIAHPIVLGAPDAIAKRQAPPASRSTASR